MTEKELDSIATQIANIVNEECAKHEPKTYRIKPLEWRKEMPDWLVCYVANADPYGTYKIYDACNDVYTAGLYHGYCCTENLGIVNGLRAAKQLAEQHWHKTLEQVLEEVEPKCICDLAEEFSRSTEREPTE